MDRQNRQNLTAQHMLNEELVTLRPRFVRQARGPSHDAISRVVMRAGLSSKRAIEQGLSAASGSVMVPSDIRN